MSSLPLWIRKTEALQSAIHIESVSRKKENACVSLRTSVETSHFKDSETAALKQLASIWWEGDGMGVKTNGVKVIRA